MRFLPSFLGGDRPHRSPRKSARIRFTRLPLIQSSILYRPGSISQTPWFDSLWIYCIYHPSPLPKLAIFISFSQNRISWQFSTLMIVLANFRCTCRKCEVKLALQIKRWINQKTYGIDFRWVDFRLVLGNHARKIDRIRIRPPFSALYFIIQIIT